MVGQKGDHRGACSVEDASIIKDYLCSNQNAVDFGHVVAYLVVVDELAIDSFEY